jgi:6-phosphogluconolactonase
MIAARVAAIFIPLVVQAALWPPASPANAAEDLLAFVGTYTSAKSQGIYSFRLSGRVLDGALNLSIEPIGLAAATPSPSFLALDAERRLLFAVNEIDRFEDERAGAVSVFSIDAKNGKLTLINQQSSRGAAPCHIVLDRAGRHVIVANYGGGSTAVLPVGEDGALGPATDVEQHRGSSVNPDRQEGPHAHCVTFDPNGERVFVCDLGLDQVLIYKYDAQDGKLEANDPPFAKLAPGAGPRHMAFGRDGRFAYVLNELNSTITAFAHDAQTGALRELATVSTLPRDFEGDNSTAEIAVHPSGQFLYASNRGRDSIALFAINAENGALSFVEGQPTGGRTPRHFAIDPAGEHLIAANQNSDSLLAFRINASSGRLLPVGNLISAPTPVCTVFLEQPSSNR